MTALLAEIPTPSPFSLRLSGGGQFGAAAWAGVDGDLEQLGELRAEVRDALTLGGHPSDDRPFHPHLTVSYHADAALRQALAGYRGDPWAVESFVLMSSAEGRYEQLASWAL